jgi:DNA-binding transcriptional LysR family regulator
LKQGIRDIEFLADPTVGELRIGCDESISAATLPRIVSSFLQQYPNVVLDVQDIDLRFYPPRLDGFDLVLTRIRGPGAEVVRTDELDIEILFDDELVIAASLGTSWARRRRIDLAELANARWILSAPTTWNYIVIAEAFHAHGQPMPEIGIKTLSVHLRTNLTATGEFITAFPRSVLELYADRFALKALPVELPKRRWPVVLFTQKGRTLTPLVERFISCAREVVSPRAGR